MYVWQDSHGKIPLWRGDGFPGPVLPVMTSASSKAQRLCLQGSARGLWVPAAPVLALAQRDGIQIIFDLHRVGERVAGRRQDAAVQYEECFAWVMEKTMGLIEDVERFCAQHKMRVSVKFELGKQEMPVGVMIAEEMIRIERTLSRVEKVAHKMRDSWWKNLFKRGGCTTKEKWAPGRNLKKTKRATLSERITSKLLRRRGPNDTERLI